MGHTAFIVPTNFTTGDNDDYTYLTGTFTILNDDDDTTFAQGLVTTTEHMLATDTYSDVMAKLGPALRVQFFEPSMAVVYLTKMG